MGETKKTLETENGNREPSLVRIVIGNFEWEIELVVGFSNGEIGCIKESSIRDTIPLEYFFGMETEGQRMGKKEWKFKQRKVLPVL